MFAKHARCTLCIKSTHNTGSIKIRNRWRFYTKYITQRTPPCAVILNIIYAMAHKHVGYYCTVYVQHTLHSKSVACNALRRLFQSQNNIDPLFQLANKYLEIISVGRITTDLIRWSGIRKRLYQYIPRKYSVHCINVYEFNTDFDFFFFIQCSFIIFTFFAQEKHIYYFVISHCLYVKRVWEIIVGHI